MFMLGSFSVSTPNELSLKRCINKNNAPQVKDCPALGVKEILRKSAYDKWTELIGN